MELQAAQFVPPVDADLDAINQVINNGIRTEFHPSGTLAMLPVEHGGVVDSHLRVWGTQNLRVVDAGVFPIIPAAHLQAVVYGVAEKVGLSLLHINTTNVANPQSKAADIIKADNLPAQPLSTPSSNSSRISTNPTLGAISTAISTGLYANSSASLSLLTSGSKTTILSSFSEATTSSSPHGSPSVQSSSSSSTVSVTTTNTARTVLTISASDSVSHSGKTVVASSTSSTPRTIVVVSKILSSTLPSLSSSIELTDKSEPSTAWLGPLSYNHPSPPERSLRSHEHLSTSVVGVLTSAGVLPPAAATLVPVIIGDPPDSGAAATAPSEMEQQEIQAAVDAFIQWLLSFFRSI